MHPAVTLGWAVADVVSERVSGTWAYTALDAMFDEPMRMSTTSHRREFSQHRLVRFQRGARARSEACGDDEAEMGNQLAAPARVQPGELLASDVPTLVYKDSLGGGRFLKTFLTRHEEGSSGGLVVVKVYLKRGNPATGGGLEAEYDREHERRLRLTREALLATPPRHLHAWPFQRELETERAVYLMRQYAHSTLYDRVSMRPFLSDIEKRWVTYQLLHALADCHERGVTHGDIKCENVLVTSWGWVFLTDFATFKPASLPADNPADYSFFFDAGGRRRCYVAPERFRDAAAEGVASVDERVTPAADVFSLGCALGELFIDGSALFDLSQLLAFRRGEHDPSASLAGVADGDARELIVHMTARDPVARLSAREYLERWTARGWFPKYFDALHDFAASLATKDADQTAAALAEHFAAITAAIVREEWNGEWKGAADAETGAADAETGAADAETENDQNDRNATEGGRTLEPHGVARAARGGHRRDDGGHR